MFRVLQINQKYYGTGAENVMRTLGEALAQLGHNVYYAVNDTPSGNPPEVFAIKTLFNAIATVLKDVDVHLRSVRSLPLDEPGLRLVKNFGINLRLFLPSVDPMSALKMNSILDIVKPDIVHGHNILGFSLSPITCSSKKKIPVLLTIHGPWPACPLATMMKLNSGVACVESDWDACSWNCSCSFIRVKKYMEKTKRTILDRVSCMVAVSNYVRGRLIDFGYPDDMIKVIHNGVDTSLFKPLDGNNVQQFEVIHAGRLSYYKGTHILMNAAKILEKERPEIVFRLVGSGIKHIEKRKNVIYEGWVTTQRLVELYSKALCVVVPSIRPEPFPITPLEAMACGTPVIGTNNGGMKESIIDGRTGYLVEPADPAGIAEKIAYLYDNPEKSRRMSTCARDHVEAIFSKGAMVRKYVDLYNDII